MHKEMKVLILDSDEQQLLVRSLYDLRNALLQKDSSAEPARDVADTATFTPSHWA